MAVDHEGDEAMEPVSPRATTTMQKTMERSLGAMNGTLGSRADADAQTTVMDFLDFTEYLPSDMIRSLNLIEKLDETYSDSSLKVDDLTTTWGQLPTLPADGRPSPVQLRADISHNLDLAVNSRLFAHAEAVRMADNVKRHYNKANVLLSKLRTMMDNYPTEEQKSPVSSRSPQLTRAKLTVRAGGDGEKTRKHRVPRITVPGEVLAPYDIEYDTFSDDSESSSEEDLDTPAARKNMATTPRIKLVYPNKKVSSVRTPKPPPSEDMNAAVAANAAALLNPPPVNATIGSTHLPWLQLTDYELAKLRKRMKKNAIWTPSETMVARELKLLNRGPDAYKEAKKTAEVQGEAFEPTVPAPVLDEESGTTQLPAGALSVEAAEELPTSNRGMKLNEAKKFKRETLAKLAAEEAEESARKMAEQAKMWLNPKGQSNGPKGQSSLSGTDSPRESNKGSEKSRANSKSSIKRKREPDGEEDARSEVTESTETPSSRPQAKRTKTETPVLPPQHISLPRNNLSVPELSPNPSVSSVTKTKPATPLLETPVPLPVPLQSTRAATRSVTSPTPIASASSNVTTTTVPTKPAGVETPVPLPLTDRRKSITPVSFAPGPQSIKRETRGDAAKRNGRPESSGASGPAPPAAEGAATRASSRGVTPHTTPAPETQGARRPSSRGTVMSQDGLSSLAADRPRRASTARNTPAPEPRPHKRTKRPAPGIVSTTSSGGNSAVGKRKAAPKKKARSTRRDKDQVETEMEEVDDEGNPIDPDEPRYCLCNGVSFGTMIQCENSDGCKLEWFHLDCVGVENLPARTTKWYCPDCRKALNIGEKGEVSARGVRK